MSVVGRLPIVLGFAVAAVVLRLGAGGWWWVLPVVAGIYLVSRVGPHAAGGERCFSTEDRRILFDRAHGRCQAPGCGRPIHFESECPFGGCRDDYQADHVTPWANGGRTVLSNEQALCRWCNLHKSARSMIDFVEDPDGDGVPGMA